MSKVLFILKRREDFDSSKHTSKGLSTGLYNSAKFNDDMLRDNGIESNMVVVVDNNDIDREVSKYKPTHVIIEALWVVPTKFLELQRLHPNVKWIVRLHSEIPFIANEGMAINWICDYSSYQNVIVAVNAPRTLGEVRELLRIRNKWSLKESLRKVVYLPNYFPLTKPDIVEFDKKKFTIDISCFGAIRPLKNQLIQAVAAIKFAEQIGKKLRFHINAGRIETEGGPVNRNLLHLFQQLHDSGHRLINHHWNPREDFLETCRGMDLGLQVSFSETFNIVAADLVSVGVPVIGSREIPWMPMKCIANPTDSDDIVRMMMQVYNSPKYSTIALQQANLNNYIERSSSIWQEYFS